MNYVSLKRYNFLKKDIRKGDESLLRLDYNRLLCCMLKKLSYYFNVKDAESLYPIEGDCNFSKALFNNYVDYAQNLYPTLFTRLFSMFMQIDHRDYFIECLEFFKLLFQATKQDKFIERLSKYVPRSKFNRQFIQEIKEPTGFEDLNVSLKDMMILIKIDKIEDFNQRIEFLNSTSFDEEVKENLVNSIKEEKEIEMFLASELSNKCMLDNKEKDENNIKDNNKEDCGDQDDEEKEEDSNVEVDIHKEIKTIKKQLRNDRLQRQKEINQLSQRLSHIDNKLTNVNKRLTYLQTELVDTQIEFAKFKLKQRLHLQTLIETKRL